MSATAISVMQKPSEYEALREQCLRIAGLHTSESGRYIQQIVAEAEHNWRRSGCPRSPLESFIWPLARFADAHAAMDQENECLRKQMLQMIHCQINPPLIYLQALPPVPPDTRSYLRRVWDAVRSYKERS